MTLRPFLSTAAAATVIGSAASVLPAAPLPHPAAAQANPTLKNIVPESEAVTIHAKIQAINPSTRQVTLLGRSGTPVTVIAGPLSGSIC